MYLIILSGADLDLEDFLQRLLILFLIALPWTQIVHKVLNIFNPKQNTSMTRENVYSKFIASINKSLTLRNW